ncbi:MAG TPA: hypothetical protein VFP33_08610 [Gallionella sp.]|nr:hypothetical protein [Gallionella sp.]
MKTTIMNVIVVAALSFNGAALAAAETGGKIQTSAAQPAPPASAAPPAAAKATLPAAKPTTPAKRVKVKRPRPKNLDLRHCLDLKTDAEIAKCAGET